MNEYIVSQPDSAKQSLIQCEHCNESIDNPLENAALAWHGTFLKDGILYHNFYITHKSSHCINGKLGRVELALWMPFQTFFKDGVFNLDWFLSTRHDDCGNLIDADVKIDLEELKRVIPMMKWLETPIVIKKPAPPSKRVRGTTEGHVYLIQSPTGAYKIGRTINPENRLKTFSVKLPFEVEYVVTIRTPNMYQLEADLHNRFSSKRINGEWFALSPADVDYIKGLAT